MGFNGHLTATFSFSFRVNFVDRPGRRRLDAEQQVVEQKVTLRLRSKEGHVSATNPPTQINPYGISNELPVDDLVSGDVDVVESSPEKRNWRWFLFAASLATIVLSVGCFRFFAWIELTKTAQWKMHGISPPHNLKSNVQNNMLGEMLPLINIYLQLNDKNNR